MENNQYYTFQEDYKLESGDEIAGLTLAYRTFGQINENKDNVIWVVHALTANADAVDWWPGIVGEDCPIDTTNFFVICVNNPGSPYGSISPMTIDSKTGDKYGHDFPLFTTRDIARSFGQLREALGIKQVHMLIGSSLGGQIAMEWAILEQEVFQKLILIATNAKHSAWGIAFNESQRLAIEADQSWATKNDDAGMAGLKAARSIALLSYRTSFGYNASQSDSEPKVDNFRASSYQRYQGDKLVRRFNAFSYYTLTKTMDSHNVGRSRPSAAHALEKIKARTLVIGITTDLLFPVEEQQFLSSHIPEARFVEIFSSLGHDGFLTESVEVGKYIANMLEDTMDS